MAKRSDGAGMAQSGSGSGIHAARERSDSLKGEPDFDAPGGVGATQQGRPTVGFGQRPRSNVADHRERQNALGPQPSEAGCGIDLSGLRAYHGKPEDE